MSRYRIFRDGKGKVIVASSYAGKIVRGVAKCNENDTYNEDTGIALATSRCDVKIANKRVKRAMAKYDAATKAVNDATAAWEKAIKYLTNAEQEALNARKTLSVLESVVRGGS